MVLDAYNAEKYNEAQENLAKFREEQKLAKMELVAEVTKGKIDQTTDYVVTAEDFKNPTPEELVRNDSLVGPLVAKQELLYKNLKAIEDTNSEEWKTAFAEYESFWNDKETRQNLAKFIETKTEKMKYHRSRQKSMNERAEKYNVIGGGVSKETRDELWDSADDESNKAIHYESQLIFLKKIFNEKNSPQAIKLSISEALAEKNQYAKGVTFKEIKEGSELDNTLKRLGIKFFEKENWLNEIEVFAQIDGEEIYITDGDKEYAIILKKGQRGEDVISIRKVYIEKDEAGKSYESVLIIEYRENKETNKLELWHKQENRDFKKSTRRDLDIKSLSSAKKTVSVN